MIFVTQSNTGTMVKCVPQEQMVGIEATLLENYFFSFSLHFLFFLVLFRDVIVFVNNLFKSKSV